MDDGWGLGQVRSGGGDVRHSPGAFVLHSRLTPWGNLFNFTLIYTRPNYWILCKLIRFGNTASNDLNMCRPRVIHKIVYLYAANVVCRFLLSVTHTDDEIDL